MGTVIGGRYATPLDADAELSDDHPAVARTIKAEKLARAIILMEGSPAEVAMAQAAWLLTTVKLVHALDYDARTMPVSRLDPLVRRLDEATWMVSKRLMHVQQHEEDDK